jgi:uncharacterized protein involved in exopolysaccharide biosynthesis/Mrp family chromosome partitioning ATPase
MHKLQQTNPSKGGLSVQDVLFVLFKHKWSIIVFSLLGFSAAAAVYIKQEPIYRSQAKLLVRYVRETGTVDPYEDIKSPGGGGKAGDSVINTEIEILNSLDLAQQVAEVVGVERLLPGAASQNQEALSQAAGVILKDLEVMPGQSSNVLHVTYGNKERDLAQTVLQQLVELYFEKHLEIHRSAAAFDVVAKQAEEVRQRLNQTDKQLNKLRTDSGIVSLAEATSALTSQRSKTQENLMKAKADFAELQASLAAYAKNPGAEGDSSGGDPPVMVKASTGGNGAKITSDPLPAAAITEYRAVIEVLAFLQKRDLELRIKFKPGNRLLALNQQQLDTYETKRRDLVAKFPDLAAAAEVLEKNADAENPRWSLIDGRAKLAAITAKIEVFEAYLKEIGDQFSKQYAIGAEIEEVDRRKQMEDAEYRSLAANLKNAKVNQTLDPSRMPNITVVQRPSSPVKTFADKTKKIILGLAGAGIGVGVALAFLMELILVRKIHRPIEIQTRLQLPLLMTIPYMRKRERGGLLLGLQQGQPSIGTSDALTLPLVDSNEEETETSLRKANHFILPFAETIRDRIVFNFEVNNVTHKPKLVAVAGLSHGAGASTIAAGLAKSFSELRGLKVLLVDLSSQHPGDNPLFGEIPRHSLYGALRLAQNSQFRENLQNLYYASASARRDVDGVTTFTPAHLNELMPHLVASEYDYIIFDMPTLDPTSRTLTMAGMMDKVLLVLDADNTNRDALLWGYSELIKGKADVSCVFNKTRTHAPGWLVGAN